METVTFFQYIISTKMIRKFKFQDTFLYAKILSTKIIRKFKFQDQEILVDVLYAKILSTKIIRPSSLKMVMPLMDLPLTKILTVLVIQRRTPIKNGKRCQIIIPLKKLSQFFVVL